MPTPNDLADSLADLFAEFDAIVAEANGAGTTAIAAQQLDRDFIGIELNPDYRDIVISRIDTATAE